MWLLPLESHFSHKSCSKGRPLWSRIPERRGTVGFSSVPVRQPVPELPEHDLPAEPQPEETPQDSRNSAAHFRLLWEQRRLLVRAVLCGLLAGMAVAFLIPNRYQSTARL